ncbi:MAG: DNA replication/repair protein RecF [Succinivibrio sp.]
MLIERLIITNYRNIVSLDVEPSKNFNIIYGPNGSGKTSFLEAISYLGLGHSFRKARLHSLINNEMPFFAISAKIADDKGIRSDNIGILRYKDSKQNSLISINSSKSNKLSDLVSYLSVQVIHPQGIELVLDGPELRRAYLDWGLYYSNKEFVSVWSNYRKLLAQRNMLLKRGDKLDDIKLWDDTFCNYANRLTELREKYLEDLTPILNEKLSKFLPNFSFTFHYSKGWENRCSLRSLLDLNLEKDRVLGYTFYGCHRADLKVKCNNSAASETLSRGQLKLLVCALRLSQGQLLRNDSGINCIYLLDDLSSELDPNSRQLLLDELHACGCQVFMTNISKDLGFQEFGDVSYLDIHQALKTQ